MKLDNFFYWIGWKVSSHPVKIITVGLAFMSILLTGLIFLEFEVIIYKINSIYFRMILKNYG
jgi:hypothetical protein